MRSVVLQAISFAHANVVVPRDIKSKNVVVHDFNRSSEGAVAASEARVTTSASSSSPPLSLKLRRC